jgi:hypothetical protein
MWLFKGHEGDIVLMTPLATDYCLTMSNSDHGLLLRRLQKNSHSGILKISSVKKLNAKTQ